MFFKSNPATLSEKTFKPSANASSSPPNTLSDFFPLNHCPIPLRFGTLLDSSINLSAEPMALSIFWTLIPAIASENCLIPSPNALSSPPNIINDCLPPKNCFKPPLLGTLFDSSTKPSAALAASIIAPLFIPSTVEENSFNPLPNTTNSVAKVDKEDWPLNHLVIESKNPAAVILTIVSANIENPFIDSGFNLWDPSIKSFALFINSDNSVPRSPNEEPSVKNLHIFAYRFAAVISSIAAVNIVTPVNTDLSIVLHPLINGWRFVMNSDKFLPISGIDAENPLATPP